MLYYRIRKKIICKKRGSEKNQDMEGLLLNPVEIPIENQDKEYQHHAQYIVYKYL